MLTFREARQRLTSANMRIDRVGASVEYRVSFMEDGRKDSERNAYYSDDIEDCMLTGLDMRRRRAANGSKAA